MIDVVRIVDYFAVHFTSIAKAQTHHISSFLVYNLYVTQAEKPFEMTHHSKLN